MIEFAGWLPSILDQVDLEVSNRMIPSAVEAVATALTDYDGNISGAQGLSWLAAHADRGDQLQKPDQLRMLAGGICMAAETGCLPAEALHRMAGQVSAAVLTVRDETQRRELSRVLMELFWNAEDVAGQGFPLCSCFCIPPLFSGDHVMAEDSYRFLMRNAGSGLPASLVEKIGIVSFIVDPRGTDVWHADTSVSYDRAIRPHRRNLQAMWQQLHPNREPVDTGMRWLKRPDGEDVQTMWLQGAAGSIASVGLNMDVARLVATYLDMWSVEHLLRDLTWLWAPIADTASPVPDDHGD